MKVWTRLVVQRRALVLRGESRLLVMLPLLLLKLRCRGQPALTVTVKHTRGVAAG